MVRSIIIKHVLFGLFISVITIFYIPRIINVFNVISIYMGILALTNLSDKNFVHVVVVYYNIQLVMAVLSIAMLDPSSHILQTLLLCPVTFITIHLWSIKNHR